MKRPAALVPVVAGAVLSSILSVAPALAPAAAAGALDGPSPVDCPTALPTASAVPGLQGTGWTVESGTEPAPFMAAVLGRITDGIAPGIDMIMARLSSPAITAAGGVWAGMSGSPVYAQDGRLIGAVAYGLAASSPIAGITPAEDLGRLLDADPDDPAAARRSRIRADASAARHLRQAGASQAQAARGFARLPMPLTLSGATSPAARTLVQRLQRRTGQRVTTGGATAQGTASPTSVFGGSNIAAAVSYGDVTLSAVGTTTYTCHGRLVAFGHPMLDAGVTTYSAHAATAVYVQPDPTNGPFKVANTGGIVGTVDRDRTLGIRARLGAGPRGTAITSRLTRTESKATRTGRTTAVYAPMVPDAAAFHTMANVDRVMGSSASTGSARLTLTITGRRANGRAFTVRHGDVLTALSPTEPLDLQAAMMVLETVSAVQDQPFEDVTISSVSLTGSVSSRPAQWSRPTVQVKQQGRWVDPARGVLATPGTTLWTRTVLTGYRAPAVHTTVKVAVVVPRSAASGLAELTVTGGVPDIASDVTPRSFDALLAQLASAQRHDEVTVALVDPESEKVLAEHSRRAPYGIDGFERSAAVLLP